MVPVLTQDGGWHYHINNMFPNSPQNQAFNFQSAGGTAVPQIGQGILGALKNIVTAKPFGSQTFNLNTAPLSMGSLSFTSNVAGSSTKSDFGTAIPTRPQPATNPQVSLGTANTTPVGTNNIQSLKNQNNPSPVNSSPSDPVTLNPSYTSNTSNQSSNSPVDNKSASNPFAMFQDPQTQAYLQSTIDLRNRLAALQGQIAQTQVPSQTEIGQKNLANQLQLDLSNLNPQQYLKDNPSLQAGGITEGQLERQVAQEQMPLEQTLSQAIISQSALASSRGIQGAALGAQATGLGAQEQALEFARQLTQFGGLPPEVANTIIQRMLFPQYNVTTGITGQPIAYNVYDPAQSIVLGDGSLGGFGTGVGGTTQGGLPSLNGQPSNINLGGLQVPVEYSPNNTPYINSTRLSEAQTKMAQLYSSQTGVPVLDTGDVQALHTLGEAKSNLQLFQQTAQQLLSPGLLGRIRGLTTNQLAQLTQTDPRWRQFQTLRAGLIKSVQGIAAGAPGLRVTAPELENAAEALPNSFDNLDSGMQAIKTFNQLLDDNEKVILGGSSSQGSTQGFSGSDTFSNAAAWR